MNYILNFLSIRRLKTNKIDDNDCFANCKPEHFNFDLISRYFYNTAKYKANYHLITDKVKDDIDLDEVFRYIDRTSSKIGQQFLYNKIRTIGTIEDLQKFEKLINIFESHPEKFNKTKEVLSRLNSDNSYYFEELIHGCQLEKPKWFILTYLFSGISMLFIVLSFFNPFFWVLLIGVFLVNFGFHYFNKSNLNYYLVAVSEFYKSIKIAKILEKDSEIKSYFGDLSFLTNIYKIKSKAQFISFEKQLNSNELYIIVWSIFELLKILFNIEIILFFRFIDDIIKEKENINNLFTLIGEIDASISVAKIRTENLQICKPIFTEDKIIEIEKITHPLIENCVSNSIKLNNRSLLLTGSNMSGKTTFIRIVSINSILAQTINTCFAEEYKAPFFKIYSSIRTSDNLFENTSYFLEEVLTIKEFISASEKNEPCFFVLDEIFKGTNTAERISAGNSILSYLNKRQHFVFVSTHDIELTELLKHDNYELYHFQEQIINNELIFDHKLKYGKLKTKNAIRILDLYNYPQEIITKANDTLSLFDYKREN